jgi:hypothetical protein
VSSTEEEDEGSEEDNLDDEINCVPEEYRSQLPDIRDVAMFGNILEVHDDVSGNADNVLNKVNIIPLEAHPFVIFNSSSSIPTWRRAML